MLLLLFACALQLGSTAPVCRPKTEMVCGGLYSQLMNLLVLPLGRPCSKGRKVNWILRVKVVVPGENIQKEDVNEKAKGENRKCPGR